MNKIPPATIDSIRDLSDIVEIISENIDLKRRGTNYFGVCPFHDEKSASFSVSPSKQIYHCFGCGEGGNIFSFLIKFEKISFIEAVKKLGDRCNINIDYQKRESNINSNLYEIHNIATNLFTQNLFSPSGSNALAYLKGRGFQNQILKDFNIGFSENNWKQLYNYLKKLNFNESEILESGLFIKSDKGIFDRFRSRIMFPIFHASGKNVAFGGRIFGIEDPAKYLNSPETILYQKSNIFYGLHLTRDSIRKKGYAILVEGYMDLMQLYQAGITPLIAVSGTSFTNSHARQIVRITKKVILLYDGDTAGCNAACKTGFMLIKEGIDVEILCPPDKLDPDDWIQKIGVVELKKKINQPQEFLEFHLEFHNASSLKGIKRKEYILFLLDQIKRITDNIIREEFIRILSERIKVDHNELIKVISKIKVRSFPLDKNNIKESISLNSVEDRAQIELIKLLIDNDSDNFNLVRSKIKNNLFSNELLNRLASYILKQKMKIDVPQIIEYFIDDKERAIISKILIEEKSSGLTNQILQECISTLEKIPIKKKIKELRMLLREKELKGQGFKKELSEIMKLQSNLKSYDV